MAVSNPAVEDGTAIRAHLDQQTEMSRERILAVEKAFATATQDMAGVVRQIAKLRDAGDLLVENFSKYTDTELPTMRDNLQAVCECLAAMEDHRQAHVSRVETQVIHPLTQYEKTCKLAKNGLKDRKPAREKEVTKQRVYDKVRRDHPNDTRKLSRALEEMQTARAEAAQVSKTTEEHMTTFQLQKLKATKGIFGDYLMSCMTFHAKSLELCSLAFQSLRGVEEEVYLEEFRQAYHRRPNEADKARQRLGSLDGSLGGASCSREDLTTALSARQPLSRALSSDSARRQAATEQRAADDDDDDDDEYVDDGDSEISEEDLQ